MSSDPLQTPADPAAQAAMAARGLRLGLVDPGDDAQVRGWIAADARGFHDPEPSDETVAQVRGDFAEQRTVAVWDDALTDPAVPVATTTSWPAALSVPGGEVTGWAISGVSVAPTHRRRGIARAMLESELRTAADAGLPVAMLTVSEATIYGRYGFGPAAWSAAYEVDARRAGWVGGQVGGRLELVDRATAIEAARVLFPAARRLTTGDVQVVGHRFDRLFGSDADPVDRRRRRFVRWSDDDGQPRGLAVYRLTEDATDFVRHTVDVPILVSTSPDAYAALWRYLLELDLVATVRAELRSVDEPLRWLVRDQRAIRTTELREHLWIRVLDPAAAFGARRYSAPGRLGLRIADPMGRADGEWLLTVDGDDAGALERTTVPEDVPLLELPVDLVGSLWLGGVSAVVLAAAGRIRERGAGDAVAADRLLHSPSMPVLTTWF